MSRLNCCIRRNSACGPAGDLLIAQLESLDAALNDFGDLIASQPARFTAGPMNLEQMSRSVRSFLFMRLFWLVDMFVRAHPPATPECAWLLGGCGRIPGSCPL